MTFDAKATINGKEHDAVACGLGFERSTDEKGAPSSHITKLKVRFKIKATEDTGILEAAFAEHKPLNGKYVCMKGDEQAKMREVEFENAYIVKYDEDFERGGDMPMVISCELTAKKVSCGNAVYEAVWT